MAEFPALPLWTDAYLGDTTHLTTIEHGAYLLLLMTAWRTSTTSLRDDDKLLARYTRMTPAQWLRIRPVIAEFFTIANGVWTQRRLSDEAGAVRRLRDTNAKNGRLSALKRKGRHSTIVERPSNDASTPTPTPTPIVEKERESPSTPVDARDDDEAGSDPFGRVGNLTARCGRAAGVAVSPSNTRYADQLDAVRSWLEMGLDPETEIIPTLEQDAANSSQTRHSLKYFTPAMARIAARKDAAANGRLPNTQTDIRGSRPDPAVDLYRAALRAEEEEERSRGNRQDRGGTWVALPSPGGG